MKDNKPVSVSISSVTLLKAPFSPVPAVRSAGTLFQSFAGGTGKSHEVPQLISFVYGSTFEEETPEYETLALTTSPQRS
jgi:hypothetical protein